MAGPLTGGRQRVAIVGAGWAGLAAAVRAVQAGHEVSVFESAPLPGGRARSDHAGDGAPDNGQHLLLGGYVRTLALMRAVGADPDALLTRTRFHLEWPDGARLALPAGPAPLARALLGARGFSLGQRLRLARVAWGWQRSGFRANPGQSVSALLAPLAGPMRTRVLEPLCVAALNTPADQADAATFLAVLRDSLFGAPGAADLLIPLRPLAQLLPLPALRWLERAGARVRLRSRVLALQRAQTDGLCHLETATGEAPQSFDAVILAASARESARLAAPLAPAWSELAANLPHASIATIELRGAGWRWPGRMLALDSDATTRPAQFAFRLGPAGPGLDRVALVVSAAPPEPESGTPTIATRVVDQWRAVTGTEAVELLRWRIERRATFSCRPDLRRPGRTVAAGVLAAGDYLESPYPATLESAVRAGEAAAEALAPPTGT